MTQLSLLPDELPDEDITPKAKRRRSLRTKIRYIIKTDGLYKYAMMATDILKQSDNYIEAKYKMGREDLKSILYSEFGYACMYQEDIDSFLYNVKNIPSYALKYNYDATKDSHREIR